MEYDIEQFIEKNTLLQKKNEQLRQENNKLKMELTQFKDELDVNILSQSV